MEDINIIIKSICQDLYENLKHNKSAFSKLKSKKYLLKLKKINKKTDYNYAEVIRDELGSIYKNYIVFSKKQDYEKNLKVLTNIKKMYIQLSYIIEQFLTGKDIKIGYSEYKNLEKYIKELESTYGGLTERYIKKLSKKRIGRQKKEIKKIYKDKSKITAEKKRNIISILTNKLNVWNCKYKKEPNVKIIYNSLKAEYIFIKENTNENNKIKKYKFKMNFSDIEQLQKNAIKNLKKMNFGISIYEELNADEECFKYTDPFIIMIFIKEGYLDYAKLYLRQVNGESKNKKYLLPFKIIYNIDSNLKNGILTPIRNEIMAIIAERSSLSVAELRKNNK
ncbi:MAG: hypothetical protein J6A89_04780 [Clostridia bacterium]|nr:hypothetical protein [Clostridia bacterium]